jgi:hypothetical protein
MSLETDYPGANQTGEKSQESSLASESVLVVAASATEQGRTNVNFSDRDQELPQTFPQRVSILPVDYEIDHC